MIKNKPKLTLAGLLVGATLLSGCAQLEASLGWANDKLNTAMDEHNYKKIPFDILLTEEDKSALRKAKIEPIPSLDLAENDLVSIVEDLQDKLNSTADVLKDDDLYARAIDDASFVMRPLNEIYSTNSLSTPIMNLWKEVRREPNVEISELSLVELHSHISKDGTVSQSADAELVVLQDSTDFLLYPVEITFDKDWQALDLEFGKPSESTFTARPLVPADAALSANTHAPFLQEWNAIAGEFDQKRKADDADAVSLASAVSPGVSMEVLTDLYVASRGSLANGSFTEWSINDKDASGVSTYRFSVPEDAEGATFDVVIEFNRIGNEIVRIQSANEEGTH